jgi:hypothetical protein
VLLVRLRLRVCVAGDTSGRLVRVNLSHAGTALLECGVLVLFLASQTAEHEETDERKTDDRSDDGTSNPSFGATSTAVVIIVVVRAE